MKVIKEPEMANSQGMVHKCLSSTWLFPLLLCLAAFACYANIFANGFVSDDCYIIQMNRDKLDLQGIITSFTSCDHPLAGGSQPYYRPLAKLVYLLEYTFFGLNPSLYHAGNIILHALATILLYRTLLQLKCTRLPSLAASLIFAVHPINAEAVNLIVALNNILVAIFVLGALLIFLSCEGSGIKGGYFISGFLFFLGLLSKETALMLFPLLIYLKTTRQVDFRNPRKLLQIEMGYLLPYLGFLLLYLPLRLIALDDTPSLAGLTRFLWQIIYIIPKYMSLIAFPVNVSFGYSVPNSYSPDVWWLATAWIALTAVAVYLYRTRNPAIEFGGVWLFLNFLPISNITPITSGPGQMADRFLYLPLIGLAVIVAERLGRLPKGRTSRLAAVAIIIIATGFSLLTSKRNIDWRDDLTFSEAQVRSVGNAESYYDVGFERFQRGESALARQALETSVTLDPRHWQASWAYYYLAILSMERHDEQQALRYLQSAEQADNVKPSPHYLLGYLYGKSGQQKAASRENGLFLRAVMFSSSHLIPEVADREPGERYRTPQRSRPAETVSMQEYWKLYHRYASGTEQYYNPGSIKWKGNTATVSARHLLGRRDRLLYAMKFIKFPLAIAAEACYDFEIKCPEHIYKTAWCEFRDSKGNILGAVDAQREDLIRYLYPILGTPMQTLFQEVCGSRQPQIIGRFSAAPSGRSDGGLFSAAAGEE